MQCSSLSTGEQFLSSALGQIDCLAQTIGTFGFGALALPGSATALALTGLLTLFVAIFGLRLLLGYRLEGRDLVGDILKVGIVLTLATSWPAWHRLGYDLVIEGPAQIAQAIGEASALPGFADDFMARLQNIDQGMAALNALGSGRLGVAQGDWLQLGLARIVWLVGALGPLALVRISAGVLLAITPLMAGLLLFGATRAVFEGWLRALAMTFLASLMLALILSAQMAMLEPWLAETLQRRASDTQTLDAPVEIVVLTLSFAVLGYAAIALVARIAFHPNLAVSDFGHRTSTMSGPRSGPSHAREHYVDSPARALLVASSISASISRDERMLTDRRAATGLLTAHDGHGDRSRLSSSGPDHDPLGSSHRRSSRRISGASTQRDRKA